MKQLQVGGRGGVVMAAVFLSVPLWVATGHAQPVANDHEIQVAAGFFHAQGSDSGTITGDASYGYFLSNPAWEVGIRQALSYSFIEDATDVWTATTIPFLNYHFFGVSQDDRILPFFGGFLGVIWNDRDATGTLGPNVGAKFFLNAQTFLVLRYRYEWFFETLNFKGITREGDDGNHVGTVGLGYVWGGRGR